MLRKASYATYSTDARSSSRSSPRTFSGSRRMAFISPVARLAASLAQSSFRGPGRAYSFANGCKCNDRFRRGMSSLHRRFDSSRLAELVQVRTVRLDTLLGAESAADGPIALWIDTEGMALEVIHGASGLLPSTRMLHVEVETEPCIGANQKLFADVEKALTEADFVLLATDQAQHNLQFNALFIRASLRCSKARQIRWWTRAARLRRAVTNTTIRLMPGKLRRKLFVLLTGNMVRA